MKPGLDQANAGRAISGGAIQNGLHQFSPHAAVLEIGIDSDGSDAGNGGPFIEAIAAGDPTVDFRDHAIETRMGKHVREHRNGDAGIREIAGKSVLPVNIVKRVKANVPAGFRVVRSGSTESDIGLGFR